jgi:predicted deacetylase
MILAARSLTKITQTLSRTELELSNCTKTDRAREKLEVKVAEMEARHPRKIRNLKIALLAHAVYLNMPASNESVAFWSVVASTFFHDGSVATQAPPCIKKSQ